MAELQITDPCFFNDWTALQYLVVSGSFSLSSKINWLTKIDHYVYNYKLVYNFTTHLLTLYVLVLLVWESQSTPCNFAK